MIEKLNFWNKISISISIISVIINLNNHPIFKNLFLGGSSYEPYHYKMPLDGTTLEQKDALIQKALHILSELLEKSTNATTLTIEEDGAAVKKYDTAIDNISSPYPEAKKSYQDFPKIKLKNIKKEKKKAKISRHKEKKHKKKGKKK